MSSYHRMIYMLAVCGLGVVSQLYLLIPVTASLAGSLAASPERVAALTSLFGFGYAAGFLLWGPLSDRLGRKRVMIPGLVGLAIFSVLLTRTRSLDMLMVLRVCQGLSASAFPPVALAWMAETLPLEYRVRGIGWMSAGFLLAGILGQVYGDLTAQASLAPAMLPLSALYLLCAGLCLMLPEKDTPSAQGSLFSIWRGLPKVLGNATLIRAYLAALVLLASFVAFYAGMALSLKPSLGLLKIDLMTVRLAAIPCMLIPLIVHRLISRFGPSLMVSFGMGLSGLSLLAIAAFGCHVTLASALVLTLASLPFTAGIALTVPSLIALVSTIMPDQRGMAVSVYTFILFVGASIGAMLPLRFSHYPVSWIFSILGAGLVVFGLLNGRFSFGRKPEAVGSDGHL